ncbi:dihydrofolate reductase family protein [Nonomuraea sp. NPDC050691]|uniref:dihydrofolate reductase family protein n=1 Tax=Nonomuraea sp. NPDC050691 TaxID=3155661 RepID=UPI0034032EB1
MRKIIHYVHTSLDGHIDGPGGEFDWPAVGPEMFAHSDELTARVDTFLYGRGVWEVMSSYWPNAEAHSDDEHDLKFAPIWRSTPKVVFSTTLDKAGWNTRIVSADLAEEVTELKRQPGKDMLLLGGSGLAGELARLGLIDEYHVVVHPVVLGGGRPLLATRGERSNLRLVGTRTFDGRTVLLHYVPAGGENVPRGGTSQPSSEVQKS